MEEKFIEFLGPLLLSAVAVGGMVYPFRFWSKDRQQFWQLWAAIALGIGVGLASDPTFAGARTGAAIGAIALPLVGWVRRRFRTNTIRTEIVESDSRKEDEHEGEGEF